MRHARACNVIVCDVSYACLAEGPTGGTFITAKGIKKTYFVLGVFVRIALVLYCASNNKKK